MDGTCSAVGTFSERKADTGLLWGPAGSNSVLEAHPSADMVCVRTQGESPQDHGPVSW